MIEWVKRRYRVCQKRNFIIWSYEDGPIKAEETNPLLKTYTHRCEPPVREAWQSPPLCHCEPAKGGRGNLPPSVIARALRRRARGNLVFLSKRRGLLRRFAPRNDSGAVPLRASRKGGVAIS